MQVQRRRLIPGLILILLGAAFLLRDYLQITPGVILILASVILLVPYLFTRWYGLLIPGMLVLGLGVSLLYERDGRAGSLVPLGLGLGFIAIFVVDLIVTRARRWWPLIPGGILAVVGAMGAFPEARQWLDKGWPAILIVLGLLVLARNFFPTNQPKTGGE